jgi:CRP-like cAMP-binding protein
MRKIDIERKEIFSLLTSKQIDKLSEVAVVQDFGRGQIVYDRKEKAGNLFILLEGEVSLRIPSNRDTNIEEFSLEIDRVINHGELFGPNQLFGVSRYMTRAKVVKPSRIMIIGVQEFMNIVRENESEFVIMTYMAKVYFQRYINAMKEFEECILQNSPA